MYVHVPFCVHRCDYCDFAVTPGANAGTMRRYVAALHAELDRVSTAPPDGAWPTFGSIFIGGGTPTLLAPEDLAGVLQHLCTALPVASDAEVTIEANPETVTAPALAALVAAGLTRLSLGAQSFDSGVLHTLGRLHAVEANARAVDDARTAGMAEISLDLIYGTPGETDQRWHETVTAAVGLGLDHVSCYALTVEPNTPFAARIRRGELPFVDEDVQADRMAAADELLTAAGLRRYEVSNWAVPGRESRHNRNYWRGGNWLALGASAHAHWRGRRWWNVRPTDRYIAEVEAGRSPVAGSESLDASGRRLERLLSGLRTVEGVAWDDIRPVDQAEVDRLVGAGLLRADARRITPTSAGLAVAGGIAARLA